MNDYFTWNGVSSKTVGTFGITVKQLPEITIPSERVTFTDIPGRNGSLTTLQGANVYDDITLSCECYVPNTSDAQAICAFLKGSGKLALPNRAGGYYEARIINQIPFSQILRGNGARTFSVNFRCKPAFRLDTGDIQTTITSGTYLTNPTGFTALPEIDIVGSGDITLLVGQQSIVLDDVPSGGIIIDSEMQEAYRGTTLLNSCMTGDFPVLGTGSTAINWTGGTVTSVKVRPRWVVL